MPLPKKKRPARSKNRAGTRAKAPVALASPQIPPQLKQFLNNTAIPKGFLSSSKLNVSDLRRRLTELNVRPTVPLEQLLPTLKRIKAAAIPIDKLPQEVKESIRALKPEFRRFHGTKIELTWFPFPFVVSPCADRFGYMSPSATRTATRLPFNVASQALLGQLGNMMGDAGREPNPASHNPADPGVSKIPSGFTYFGQFVDHDITFDVSSTLDADTDANTINNMRTPMLDLDSVYGRGPGLDPFLYVFPSSGPSTAIKFQSGTNTNTGAGGPSSNGTAGGMQAQSRFD